MDIEIKRMSSDTIELFDQLNIVCKRFHVDYLHASEKDKFFVEAVALHEYQLKKAHEQPNAATRCLHKGSPAVENAPPKASNES